MGRGCMAPQEYSDNLWSMGPHWTVLFTCCGCGSDVLQVIRSNPDELVRCAPCETQLRCPTVALKHCQRQAGRVIRTNWLATREVMSVEYTTAASPSPS
jgi:hypothetical protein